MRELYGGTMLSPSAELRGASASAMRLTMCNRYRLSEGDYAKLEAQGVVPPFPPDESWPPPRNAFEGIDILPKYRSTVAGPTASQPAASWEGGFRTRTKGA
jgi:hypothetical protein